MENAFTIRVADERDVYLIQEIANKVWPLTYNSIVPAGQVEYMLQLIYNPDSLKDQMNRHHQFLILEQGKRPIGFASYSAIEPGLYKLHKLYVLTELQGKGAGKFLLDQVINNIRHENAEKLFLTVNRNNNAKIFYEKQGFKVIREEKADIGNGYFMDDYIMELKLRNE